MGRFIAGAVGTISGLLVGGVLGAFAAGNCATSLRVAGQAGYEVGGWGGAFLGALLGGFVGLRLGRGRAR